MNQKMNLRNRVLQITSQLEISEKLTELRLLDAMEGLDVKLFSMDGEDFVHIPIDKEEEQESERLDGLFISIVKNKIYNNGTFLQIRIKSDRRDIFVPFIAELIIKDLSNPINSLNETLLEWKELWSGKFGRLNRNQQRGLIGELISLNKLIDSGDNSLIKYWGGPLKWIHDFESEKVNLEIKTTNKQPESVYISMIKQVSPMEGSKELHLVVVSLENGDDFSLNDVVNNLREKITESDKISQFEFVLKRSGYRDSDALHYDTRYSISHIQSHKITEASPVLKPSILGEIPSTVENIRYNLEVHAMEMEIVDDDKWKYFAKLM